MFWDCVAGSTVLAIVLAAVAAGAGAETSRTCSRFVSVKSSLEGVMFAACSELAKSEAGGVDGTSADSLIGGGSPGISGSVGSDVAATGGSTGGSWLGTVRFALGGAGLLNMLAQLLVPSGFELGFGAAFGSSAVTASAGDMFSQASMGVLSGTAVSPVTPSIFGVLSHAEESAGVSSTLGAAAGDFPPRPIPRPRSAPLPRPPRTLS